MQYPTASACLRSETLAVHERITLCSGFSVGICTSTPPLRGHSKTWVVEGFAVDLDCGSVPGCVRVTASLEAPGVRSQPLCNSTPARIKSEASVSRAPAEDPIQFARLGYRPVAIAKCLTKLFRYSLLIQSIQTICSPGSHTSSDSLLNSIREKTRRSRND